MPLPSFKIVRHPVEPGVYLLPGSVDDKGVKSAFKYEAVPGDLFLCNYPKCGVTWLQNITWRVLHNGEGMTKQLREHVAFLEFDGAEHVQAIRTESSYNMIKTHLPFKWVPKHPEAKYIFIAREPKDVLVSQYYHIKGFPQYYPWEDPSFDDLVQGFLEGKLDSTDYFAMLREWFLVRDDPNILFLLYEDVKTDKKSSILKIAEFLGQEHLDNLTANGGEVLQKIVDETTVKKMQSEGIWTKAKRDIPFIRKGIIGDWKSHLTAEQASAIDEKLKQTSDGLGCEKLWDKWK